MQSGICFYLLLYHIELVSILNFFTTKKMKTQRIYRASYIVAGILLFIGIVVYLHYNPNWSSEHLSVIVLFPSIGIWGTKNMLHGIFRSSYHQIGSRRSRKRKIRRYKLLAGGLFFAVLLLGIDFYKTQNQYVLIALLGTIPVFCFTCLSWLLYKRQEQRDLHLFIIKEASTLFEDRFFWSSTEEDKENFFGRRKVLICRFPQYPIMQVLQFLKGKLESAGYKIHTDESDYLTFSAYLAGVRHIVSLSQTDIHFEYSIEIYSSPH